MKKTVTIFKRLCAAALCAATVFSAASCKVVDKTDDTNANTSAQTDAVTELVVDYTKDIYKTSNISLNEKEIYYYMYEIVDVLSKNNAGQFEMYGGTDVDLTKSLKDQKITSDQTWYEYCIELIPEYVEYYLIFGEAGNASGIKLTDDEKRVIKSKAEKTDLGKYANKIGTDTVEQCLTLAAIAEKYKNSMLDSIDISDEALNKEISENESSYKTVDYYFYTIPFDDEPETDNDSLEEETVLTSSQAKAFSDALKACKDSDEFKSVLALKLAEYYPELKEDDIETSVKNSYAKNDTLREGYTIMEWMFEADRKQYDVYCDEAKEMQNAYTVVMLDRLPSYDESKTVDAYHILLTKEVYGSDDAAKNKADELLAQITAAEDKLEEFKKLAFEYTEDPGSLYTGGLYQNITEGQMVTEFNDWCFDEARKEGDCDIVKTSYGYHIMYFKGPGLTVTKAQAAIALQDDGYSAGYEKTLEENPIEANENRLKAVEF